MAATEQITSQKDVASLLETETGVIAALAKAHEIKPKRLPHNGNGKGYTEADIRVFAKALNRKLQRQGKPG